MQSTQKPNPSSVIKGSFLFIVRNWRQAIAVLAIPMLICVGFRLLELIPSIGEKLNWLEDLLVMPISAFIGVYWYCFFLKGEKIKGLIAPLRFRKTELRYMWVEFLVGGSLLLFALLGLILIEKPLLPLGLFTNFHMNNIKNITYLSYGDACWLMGGMFCIILCFYCLTRVSFVFPAISLGGPINIRNSWRQTKGITLRFLFAMGLILLILMLVSSIVAFVGTIVGLSLKTTISSINYKGFSGLEKILSIMLRYLYILTAITITSYFYKFRNPDVEKSYE